jgi:hypothetical protein
MVFMDPHQGNDDVMPFSSYIVRLIVEFIGVEIA